ncbi:MAG TPA: hypothetical protein VEY08_14440 [Chloroflexia bacterium]|nr:hypothetical protein [Chloroflexia bacterium]
MVKVAVKTIVRVGRAATSVVGLAVVLALSVGVASSALAGTGVGATFNLGQTNTVNAVSKLVGSVAAPSLQIDNNAKVNATALELQAEAGKIPMKVDYQSKVALLNVDKLDGQDAGAFVAARTYVVDKDLPLLGGGSVVSEAVGCDAGDVALGGGHPNAAQATHVEASGLSLDPRAWQAVARNGSANANNALVATVRCADLPLLR